jgi:pimeloyl-ACP methyl ester carboxylesterase
VNAWLVEMFAADVAQGFAICDAWDVDQSGPIEAAPVVSDVPTLILAGDIDPFTPPAWALDTAKTLSKAQVATFPGLGHGLFLANGLTDGCVGNLVEQFLDKPSVRMDMACVEKFAAGPIKMLP